MGCRRRLLWSQKRHATPISFDLSQRAIRFRLNCVVDSNESCDLTPATESERNSESASYFMSLETGENEETEEAGTYQITVKNCLSNRLDFRRIGMTVEIRHEWKCDNFLLCVKDEGLSAYWFQRCKTEIRLKIDKGNLKKPRIRWQVSVHNSADESITC